MYVTMYALIIGSQQHGPGSYIRRESILSGNARLPQGKIKVSKSQVAIAMANHYEMLIIR